MNTHDIVKRWLQANHFDGLSLDDCGCGLDDFAPCDSGPYPECQSARAHVVQCGEHYPDAYPGDILYIPAETPNPPLTGAR